MSDWRQYYSKAKSRAKSKKYYHSHPEKMRQIREKYKTEHYDKWLEDRRKGYAKWISKPENRAKKKAYQREWYQRVKKKSEREQRQEIYKTRDMLKKGKRYISEPYEIEMKKKDGMYFFYVYENGKIRYTSEGYNDVNKCVKELLEAV